MCQLGCPDFAEHGLFHLKRVGESPLSVPVAVDYSSAGKLAGRSAGRSVSVFVFCVKCSWAVRTTE